MILQEIVVWNYCKYINEEILVFKSCIEHDPLCVLMKIYVFVTIATRNDIFEIPQIMVIESSMLGSKNN